jgi:hypothetical protein
MFYKQDIEGPGTVAQQPLQPCAVLRDDAHRGIQGQATGLPSKHLADIFGLDQPAAREPTQHPHAHLLGDRGEGVRRQCCRGPEADSFGVIGGLVERLEHPVDDATTTNPPGADLGAR